MAKIIIIWETCLPSAYLFDKLWESMGNNLSLTR